MKDPKVQYADMKPSSRHRTLAIFLVGALWGIFGTLMSLAHTETPNGRALKASYFANQSDRRPLGYTAMRRQAGLIWDTRNAEGFEWGQRMGLLDPRTCPGDHGPFHTGCVEAAKGRAGAIGRMPRLN